MIRLHQLYLRGIVLAVFCLVSTLPVAGASCCAREFPVAPMHVGLRAQCIEARCGYSNHSLAPHSLDAIPVESS